MSDDDFLGFKGSNDPLGMLGSEEAKERISMAETDLPKFATAVEEWERDGREEAGRQRLRREVRMRAQVLIDIDEEGLEADDRARLARVRDDAAALLARLEPGADGPVKR